MITKPIYNIAELFPPLGEIHEGVYKTNGTSTPPTIGNYVSTTNGGDTTRLYVFNDGYRQLSALGLKKYIDPFTGNISNSPSIIDGKTFTQELDYPISVSTYSNYLASGIYLSDSEGYRDYDGEDDISKKQHGENGRENGSNQNIGLVNNGEPISDGFITIYLYGTEDTITKPRYPYRGGTVGAYTAPQ